MRKGFLYLYALIFLLEPVIFSWLLQSLVLLHNPFMQN
jgi:hypothetical protein